MMGRRTSACEPVRKMRPDSRVYLSSSETDCIVSLCYLKYRERIVALSTHYKHTLFTATTIHLAVNPYAIGQYALAQITRLGHAYIKQGAQLAEHSGAGG